MILDDAIVNQREFVMGDEWMSILFGGSTMGRPTCMSNTHVGMHRISLECAFQLANLARHAQAFEVITTDHFVVFVVRGYRFLK